MIKLQFEPKLKGDLKSIKTTLLQLNNSRIASLSFHIPQSSQSAELGFQMNGLQTRGAQDGVVVG